MAGETTSLSAVERKVGRKQPDSGFCGNTFSKAFSTTQNESADVMEMGMLPSGIKLIGFIYAPSASMAASALVHKITVGSTDVATGIVDAVLATKVFIGITPLDITVPTLVKVTATTAATTPAAATLNLTPVYSSL